MLKGEHSAIRFTFIKLPFVNNIFVLSIFEWPFYSGLIVVSKIDENCCKQALSTLPYFGAYRTLHRILHMQVVVNSSSLPV